MAIGITGYHSYAAQGIAKNYAPASLKNRKTEKAEEAGSEQAVQTGKQAGSEQAVQTGKQTGLVRTMAGKQAETIQAAQAEKRQGAVYPSPASRRQGMTEYVRELAKLAPSMEVRIGSRFPNSRSGRTLTIHPGLLNKMQHDPQQEQATKEMIQGAEFLNKWLDGLYKATGRTVVFRHSYIDENGKYRVFSHVRNDKSLQMSKKMRVQRQKNAQKLIAKTRAKAAKKQRTVGTKLDVRC
ncbi:MAG: hypothetical protein K2N87_09845 [Eubacterium sp.]|nr:hypothetical protein [Eubacterium sp.]